ncbi:MAG: porin [Burkholderiales bacterium]|nr:porin [Burkholderiales bacterium]
MNKKLVAVAVAGLLAAPLAAQAQTANVTLYGRLNMTMEAVKAESIDPNLPATAGAQNRTLYRINSNSSRLGVKGSEALGGGLSAIFQIESNVNADISGGVLATRDTYAGLQGSWGTVKVGYFLMPYDDIHAIFGNVPTLLTSIFATSALWAQGGSSIDNGGMDSRAGNQLRYDSPRIGGFVGSASVAAYDFTPGAGQGGLLFGTDAQAKRHAYIGSLGGFYNNGPFQGGIAYQFNEGVRGHGLDDWALSVAANWNFGVVKVGGVYERLDYETPSGNLKRNFWGIGATVPLGPGEAYAYWGDASNGSGGSAQGTRVGNLVNGGGTGATQWEVTYTYALSKRTLTYAGFVQIRNDDNTNYNFSVNGYPGTLKNGTNVSGFALGFVHFF